MASDRRSLAPAWRRLIQLVVAVLGVAAIVGSGGGFPEWKCCDFGPLPPSATVRPHRLTAQVGAPATFSVSAFSYTSGNAYAIQWCRQPRGGSDCTDIAGANGSTYTMPAANLSDDGATFMAKVTDANGTGRGAAVLTVSSASPVVLADGDFASSAWSVVAVETPPGGGGSHSESRQASGGHPDAFRQAGFGFAATPCALQVFHLYAAAAYDPAAQGAVHVIDFGVDCVQLSAGGTNTLIEPAIEQGGRRYVATYATGESDPYCVDTDWRMRRNYSVKAEEFLLTEGPACGFSETCPDFSAQGAPMRLGFSMTASNGSSGAAGQRVHGIDNWSATVWRR